MTDRDSPQDPRGRLVALAGEQRTSLAALSAMIGRNPAYLQQFVRKGSPRKLEEGDRRRLAAFFGVDEAQLGGEAAGSAQEKSYISQENPRGVWIDVHRLALDASAGPGALASAEAPVGTMRFAASWMRAQGLSPAMLSGIAVAGDSMEPTLRDGDEILVDRTPRPLRAGVHVVRVDDALLVKRLDHARPGVLTLLSDNPAYPPREMRSEEVQIVGRVVWRSGKI